MTGVTGSFNYTLDPDLHPACMKVCTWSILALPKHTSDGMVLLYVKLLTHEGKSLKYEDVVLQTKETLSPPSMRCGPQVTSGVTIIHHGSSVVVTAMFNGHNVSEFQMEYTYSKEGLEE